MILPLSVSAPQYSVVLSYLVGVIMAAAVAAVASSVLSDISSGNNLSSADAFEAWETNARTGSLYLDRQGRLYVATRFNARQITDKAIVDAMLERERLVRSAVLRNRAVIRWLCGIVVALVISNIVVAVI